jgi:hypothetical protein
MYNTLFWTYELTSIMILWEKKNNKANPIVKIVNPGRSVRIGSSRKNGNRNTMFLSGNRFSQFPEKPARTKRNLTPDTDATFLVPTGNYWNWPSESSNREVLCCFLN